jgi:thiamine biosynthesis lipoprotein
LKLALEESGFASFNIEEKNCRIARRNSVLIDCGGFGKGEALDRLLAISSTHAFLPWLADLGGQIAVYGHSPGSSSWKVDLAHPVERCRAVMSVNIDRGSLSTSGGSERDLEVAGRHVGHILDPRTGLPAGFRGSVTVWHERALVADILSTALYVMGPDKGKTWAETRNIAACFFVPPPEESRNQEEVAILPTQAFSQRFIKGQRGVF